MDVVLAHQGFRLNLNVQSSQMSLDVQQITGTARSVSQLLSNNRYGLDFYQREYSWKKAQVGELLDDLTGRFLHEFDPDHQRPRVASYRPYFLGPIVTAQRGGTRFLVDGQQRITTLTLLLIYLRKILADGYQQDRDALTSLIFSSSFGKETFNLDVEERNDCMTAILHGRDFDTAGLLVSVRNLWDRYHTIEQRFPHDDMREQVLPYFVDWLKHRVILVDIGAVDQDMALEIFETMNDRGLRLSNIDMLKSHLLAKLRDEDLIRDLNDRWRERVTELKDAEANADSEFVKAWLRGDYAQTQRRRRAKATPGDFEIIGTAFHKWVLNNARGIGLEGKADYQRFIERHFLGLSSRYLELLRACHEMKPGLEAVFYNSHNGFTLQLPVILAAITPDDDDDTFCRKAALVAGALDIFVARRIVNRHFFGYSTVVYTMFNLMKEVRNHPVPQVREILAGWLESEVGLDGIRYLRLHQRNRRHIHYLLARITSWLDGKLESGTTFVDYVSKKRKHPYEVEHIWADHFKRHVGEFDNVYEFSKHRDRVGDLLLLPKDFNASFGDMPYDEKFEHYNSQNPLARSLHPLAYDKNPSFRRLMDAYDLPFKPYPCEFTKTDIDERQELYGRLAEVIWDPERIGL